MDQMSRRNWIAASGGILFAAISHRAFAFPPLPAGRRSADLPSVHAYLMPDCDCCTAWVEHLRKAGFAVTTEIATGGDFTPWQKRYRIPPAIDICHLATVGAYVLVGHVPADLVRQMLGEQPRLLGIMVPGMPAGSPGMEGMGRAQPYDVLALHTDGRTTVYAKR